MAAWEILLPGFAFSLLLVFTHTYLGLHVLARGIIFIDLALAQFAALGASIAFLLGQDVHGSGARGYAFAAAIAAALAFSMLRRVPGKTTREAIIGSAYVVATALSILLLKEVYLLTPLLWTSFHHYVYKINVRGIAVQFTMVIL